MNALDIYHVNNEKSDNKRLFVSALHANSFASRMRGLLGKPPLKDKEGLLLSPCAQVHTLGMRYPLDIIFIDKTGKIVKCVEDIKPFRFAASTKAHHTLEVKPGSVVAMKIKAGDQLSWQGLA